MSEPRLSERITRLEQILARLEREDLDLDDALALFEEGVSHLRQAEQLVRVAELRIERLLDSAAGSGDDEPAAEAP
ncbi:MAG TPA: exodeoxyribonuclease VII small subunit [Longimicrobiales bacterium]|nr:exodeoxyribonuclease VII small subunit [Longimicrobiales bacterium]